MLAGGPTPIVLLRWRLLPIMPFPGTKRHVTFRVFAGLVGFERCLIAPANCRRWGCATPWGDPDSRSAMATGTRPQPRIAVANLEAVVLRWAFACSRIMKNIFECCEAFHTRRPRYCAAFGGRRRE